MKWCNENLVFGCRLPVAFIVLVVLVLLAHL